MCFGLVPRSKSVVGVVATLCHPIVEDQLPPKHHIPSTILHFKSLLIMVLSHLATSVVVPQLC